jgi:hypothetical protein
MYKRDGKVSGTGFVTEEIHDIVDCQPFDSSVRMEAQLEVPSSTLNAALEARFFSTMNRDELMCQHLSKLLSWLILKALKNKHVKAYKLQFVVHRYVSRAIQKVYQFSKLLPNWRNWNRH